MRNILVGFILIFLNFTLTLNNSRLGLIPDFIGYFIMVKGLVQMSEESPLFMKVKPYATGMIVYTGVLYFLDLFGVLATLEVFSYITVNASAIISLYISYYIVRGVIDMEGKYSTHLNGETLNAAWTLMVVLEVLTFVSMLIPFISIICMIINVIVSICFLVAFNHSNNLYYDTIGKNM
ncbi:MAG: hypothetical protein ACERKZ_04615 [Lachnotalea sp.]